MTVVQALQRKGIQCEENEYFVATGYTPQGNGFSMQRANTWGSLQFTLSIGNKTDGTIYSTSHCKLATAINRIKKY